MNICSVLGCKNTSGVSISFQKFPTDPDIRNGWIKATGREDWVPLENSVICLAHFDGSQITVKNRQISLVDDAIPRVSLPYLEENTTPLLVPDNSTVASMSTGSLRQRVQRQDILLAKQRAKIKLLQTKLKRTLKKIDSIELLLEPIQEKLSTLKNVNLQVQDILLKQIKKDSKGNMKTEI